MTGAEPSGAGIKLSVRPVAAGRAVGVSPATLCGYRGDKEKLKSGSARTVARIAKFRRLSMEEKARLMDELAE